MEAQRKKGGKIFKGKLAEILVNRGIAKKIETRGRKPVEKQTERENTEISKEVKQPEKITAKKQTKSK